MICVLMLHCNKKALSIPWPFLSSRYPYNQCRFVWGKKGYTLRRNAGLNGVLSGAGSAAVGRQVSNDELDEGARIVV